MDCAKCGRHFHQHSPVNALWCDRDRHFLCGTCTRPSGPQQPRRCPFCRSRVSRALSAGFALALTVLVIGLLWGSLFLYEADFRASLQAVPEVPIASVHDGEHVRLFGQISSTQSPVLSAIWIPGAKGGGHWSWSGHGFELVQGSASVWVDVSGMLGNMFGPAPHSTDSPSQEFYYAGDYIAVVGWMAGSGNGSTVHAEAAAETPIGFSDPLLLFLSVAGFSLAAGGGVFAAFAYVKAVERVRAHMRRERQPGMYDYRIPDPSSAPAPENASRSGSP